MLLCLTEIMVECEFYKFAKYQYQSGFVIVNVDQEKQGYIVKNMSTEIIRGVYKKKESSL